MADDLPIETIVDFIIGDFKDAWESLAARSESKLHRGNFMFARQAMTLLEVACRLCHSDTTGQALKDFSRELAKCDSRYFTQLPGTCWTPANPPEFYLPSQGNPGAEMIAALFDLIRNGQAHQYQQIRARLTDDKDFQFALTGAKYGLCLSQTFANGRPGDHLKALRDAGDLWVKVRVDVLFLDIKNAVDAAGLRALKLDYLSRPRNTTRQLRSTGTKPQHYHFSSTDLESRLQSGGHF